MFTLERADNLAGDPAAIKAACLCTHTLAIDIAFKPARIKRQVIFNRCEFGKGFRISPGCILHAMFTLADTEIRCASLPFTKAGVSVSLQAIKLH